MNHNESCGNEFVMVVDLKDKLAERDVLIEKLVAALEAYSDDESLNPGVPRNLAARTISSPELAAWKKERG